MSGNQSSSRSFLSRHGINNAPNWLTSMAEDNTLSALLNSHSLADPTSDVGDLDRVVVEVDNTLFRELEPDPALRDLVNERTLEPLMMIGKPEKLDIKPPLFDGRKVTNSKEKTNLEKAAKAAAKKQEKEAKKKNSLGTAPHLSQPPLLTQTINKTPQRVSQQANQKKIDSAASTSSAVVPKRKVQLNSLPTAPKGDSAADAKKKALRSAFSAFMHLHHPCMTATEQAATLALYEGRESELWENLAKRFGNSAVPSRLLQPVEAARGSVKIQLIPTFATEEGKETARVMKESGIDCETKETVTRLTTVANLISDLELRWEAINTNFKSRGYHLYLFSVGSNVVLPSKAIVRDSIVDGCIEYAWCSTDRVPQSTEEEDWNGAQSLTAVVSPSPDIPVKTIRRIQPIPVAQESAPKRIHAEQTSFERGM